MKTRKTIGMIGIVMGLALCRAATSYGVVRDDVSGTWSGKATCRGFDPTLPKNGKFTLSSTVTLLIQDIGDGILNVSGSDAFAGAYSGHVLKSSSVHGHPQAAIISCSTTVSPLSGHLFDAQFTIRTDAQGVDKSSMKTTSIYTLQPSSVATCKWTFKRTSTAPVAVDGCTTPTPTPTPVVTPTPSSAYQIICECAGSPNFTAGACGADCSTPEIIAQCTPACQAAGGTYEFSIDACDFSSSCSAGPIATPTPGPTPPVRYSVSCECSDGSVAKGCADDCSSGTTTIACSAGCAALGSSYVESPTSCAANPACSGGPSS